MYPFSRNQNSQKAYYREGEEFAAEKIPTESMLDFLAIYVLRNLHLVTAVPNVIITYGRYSPKGVAEVGRVGILYYLFLMKTQNIKNLQNNKYIYIL